MDFGKVLKLIISEFNKENINYALMGGFAIGVWGIVRATMDLDFLVDYNDLPKAEKIMKKYYYECVYKTKNVSQFVSYFKPFGEIDLLHAFRDISLSMLARSKEVSVFEGKSKVKVLIPEDIIGLKLQALNNNPARKNKELLDVEEIVAYFKKKLNWDLIKEYFLLFKMEKEYKNFKKKYGYSK